jgi:hypothetical protein
VSGNVSATDPRTSRGADPLQSYVDDVGCRHPLVVGWGLPRVVEAMSVIRPQDQEVDVGGGYASEACLPARQGLGAEIVFRNPDDASSCSCRLPGTGRAGRGGGFQWWLRTSWYCWQVSLS